MKRFIIISLALLLAVSVCGCIRIDMPSGIKATEAPAQQNTDAPTATDSPEGTVTDEPGEQHAVGFADFMMKLAAGNPYALDIDFDGLDDSVLIEERPEDDDGYYYHYVVTVSLGSEDPGTKHVYEYEYGSNLAAWILDCDPTDSRYEVVLTYFTYDELICSSALRVAENGKDIDEFQDYCLVVEDEMNTFTSAGGFPVHDYTDVWGTSTLVGRMTVGKKGFELVSDGLIYYDYDDPEYNRTVELVRSLEVTIVDENGNEQGTYTAQVGDFLTAYKTDAERTYLILILPDGRLGKVSVQLRSWEEWGDDCGVYINGVNQDEYGSIMYAG